MSNLQDDVNFDAPIMDVPHKRMISQDNNQDNKDSFHVVVEGSGHPRLSSGQKNVNAAKIIEKVQEKFEMLPKDSQKPCIFKIPKTFRAVSSYVKDMAYTPCRVSIGPYHAEKSDLKPMQQHKIEFVTKLLCELSRSHKEDELIFRNKFAETILSPKNVLEAQKYYYAETKDHPRQKNKESRDHNPKSDNSFEEMVLVDGVFIVGFLCAYDEPPKKFNIEAELLTAREKMEILRDLLLLENQLPFFILEETYKFFFPKEDEHHFKYIAYLGLRHLIPVDRETKLTSDMVRSLCSPNYPSGLNNEDSLRDKNRHHVKHLLHLMIFCCLPLLKSETNSPNQATNSTKDPSHPFRSVTELREAGVKFQRIKRNHPMLVNFNKEKGVLELPRLILDEFTESLFRNMVAFELYYLDTVAITSYVHFMDHLIDTTNDVKLLQRYDLVENWLESKENATTIFNCISKHTLNHYQFLFQDYVSKDLKEYVNKRKNRWMAKLYRDYFGNPWSVISFIAALVLLILTIIQAITSLRQVNWL